MKIYRGEDSIKKFNQEMLKEVEYCRKTIRSEFNKELVMSDKEEETFRNENEVRVKLSQGSLPHYRELPWKRSSRLL